MYTVPNKVSLPCPVFRLFPLLLLWYRGGDKTFAVVHLLPPPARNIFIEAVYMQPPILHTRGVGPSFPLLIS